MPDPRPDSAAKPASPAKAAGAKAAPVAVKADAPAPVPAAKAVPLTPAAKPADKPVEKKPAYPIQAAAAPARKLPAARAAITAAKEPTMNDTVKKITDKTETMFTEANDRAKLSMEKGAKMVEEMNAFHKGNLEAMVESSKIAAKGFEKIGQDAAAYAKTSYEQATAALKSMTAVKSPTELFKLQSDYARTSFDAMVAETSRSTEAMLKLAGEIAQPISNRVAIAADKVKVAA